MENFNTSPVYNGNLMGDAETDQQIFQMGDPISVTSEEAGDIMLAGAPIKQVVTNKLTAKTPFNSMNSAQKTAVVAAAVGANISTMRVPHIAVSNGIRETISTHNKIPGGGLKLVIETFFQQHPIKRAQKQGQGKADGSLVVVSFGKNEATALGDYKTIAVPVFFIVVTSTLDAARPGMPITVRVKGKGHAGGSLDSFTDGLTRTDTTRPMNLVLIPTIETGQTLIPQLALFGTVEGVEQTVDFEFDGLGLGDTVQVATPGYDSERYRDFVKKLGLNIL